MAEILDTSHDTLLIYLRRFHSTTVNIICRVKVNAVLSEAVTQEALNTLQKKHPLLGSPITARTNSDGKNEFVINYNDQIPLKSIHHITNNEEIDNLLHAPSQQLHYNFDIEQGEQLQAHFFTSKKETLIELSFAHLIGDVASILTLTQDFLNFVDIEDLSQQTEKMEKVPRLLFEESRYSWDLPSIDLPPIEIPEPTGDSQWPEHNAAYRRYKMPQTAFKKLSAALKEKSINASSTDLFYLAIARMYEPHGDDSLNLASIQSYRHLLPKEDQETINTAALLKPIEINHNTESEAKLWLEEFKNQRISSITPTEVFTAISFMRNLNETLSKCSHEQGKQLLHQIMPRGFFAINNYGKVDHYFDNFNHLKVTDLDIQGGAPGDEVRMFGLHDSIYMAAMLDTTGPIDIDLFWPHFETELNKILLEL